MTNKPSEMADCASCARMILAAKAQAYEEAIGLLDMVERYGVRVLPKALDDLRAKHAALAEGAEA